MRTCFLGIDLQRGFLDSAPPSVLHGVIDLMTEKDWATVWATQRITTAPGTPAADSVFLAPVEGTPDAELTPKWAFWPTRTFVRTDLDFPPDALKALLDKGFDKIVLAGVGPGLVAIESQLRDHGMVVERAEGACAP